MAQKILIVGSGADVKDALLLAKIKEKHGNDIVLVTPEEARKQGLELEDIANIPTMTIVEPKIIPMVDIGAYKTGKEKRREKRKKQRMTNNIKTKNT